eukprot:TRINITY_DN9019_c0_g1_i1.p1 TRINITY_DN9019_c0_g1~~TRINITY_DN9019_c0_g1_i1.p1  ORF type:complete len:2360 (+),score=290.07 TRINITY_DN9019_c0_g1_i1:981-8060(+)
MNTLVVALLVFGVCTEFSDRTECDCRNGASCRRQNVDCVNDKHCEVSCRQRMSSCSEATVNCPEWGSCVINCETCSDVTINCPTNTVSRECEVRCEQCVNVKVNPASMAKLICFSNNTASCDVATVNSTYPSGTSLSCSSLPPSVGLLNATAFPYCVLPTPHGYSCQDYCSNVLYTCIDGSWNPPTPANCELPTSCAATTFSRLEIESNKKCLSYDIPLQDSSSPEECLDRCLDQESCYYFSFNEDSGSCLWEQSQFQCSEGTVDDVPVGASNTSTNVYQVVGPSPACSGHGYCTSVGCICFKSAETGFWDGLFCDKCSPGYATATCKVPCNGGACTPCSGHGWCNEGVDGDGTCSCGGNWDGPSCSECSPNHYGTDCRGDCPIGTTIPLVCSKRGVCDDGTTGAGECACQDGWQPPLCDICTPNRWGIDCSNDCPGGGNCSGHGTCDSVNGTCSCDPLFTGSSCAMPCDCNGHGICSSDDRLCQCDGNFDGPNCAGCKPGYGDPLCATVCQGGLSNICNGHGDCTTIGQSAQCDCDTDWYTVNNSSCSSTCPVGIAKQMCSGHGKCSGTPLLSCVCSTQWKGIACGHCSDEYSGVDCSKPCPKNANTSRVCSGRGTCFDGDCHCDDSCGVSCEIDSILCDQLCGPGLFLKNCTGECFGYDSTQVQQVLCSGHGYCDDGKKGSGLCQCDINNGWGGLACDQQCPTTSTEYTCSGNGLCTPINDNKNVTCTCFTGFAGSDCSLQCPTSRSGICSKHGQCTSSGTCLCDPQWGGNDCSVYCGCLPSRGYCNSTLMCECAANFNGTTCELCANGLQGPNCTKPCINGISTNSECHCLSDWSGDTCDDPCPTDASGRYICNGNGICISGSDRQQSTCVCNDGWFGEACTSQCNDIVCGSQYPYGHGVCNSETGACMCDENYQGVQCDECADGFWGYHCDKPCPCNPTGGRCSPTTGECLCYNSDITGYHTGSTCGECHPDWTGLPHCTTPNTPITHHNTLMAPIQQLHSNENSSKLLFLSESTGLGYAGGDPIILYNLSSQSVGGIALLNSCPIIKGWEWKGKVYLLAQACPQYGNASVLRISNPPTSESDWDGRGIGPPPPCSPLTKEVCVLSEIPDSSQVLDSNWYSAESPLVVVTTSVLLHIVWVDISWGIAISVSATPAAPPPSSVVYSPQKVASLKGSIYFACGTVTISPAWFCSSFLLNKTTLTFDTLGNDIVSGVSIFRWSKEATPSGSTPVPIYTFISAVLGTDNEMMISGGTAYPERTEVVVIRYKSLCPTCKPSVDLNTQIPILNNYPANILSCLTYDSEQRSVYGTVSSIHRQLEPSFSSFLYRLDLESLTVTSSLWITDVRWVSGAVIDIARRVVYLLTDLGASIMVFSAMCPTDASPHVVLRDYYSTKLTLSGFGFKTVVDSESDPACYFSSQSSSFTSTATVLSGDAVECIVAHIQNVAICGLNGFVDVSVFNPIGEVPPYVSSCKVSYLYGVHPVISKVSPLVSPLDVLSSVTVTGSGFQTGDGLTCRYRSDTAGEFFVNAVLLSATELSCLQPPLSFPVKDMLISVSADGQHFSSELPVSFSSHEAKGLDISFETTDVSVIASNTTKLPPLRVFLTDEVGNRHPPGSDAYQTVRPVLVTLVDYVQDEVDVSYLGNALKLFDDFSGNFQASLGGGGLDFATFSNLVLGNPRVGEVTLAATSPGLASANVSFKVTSGEPTALVFLQQPHSTIERFSGNIIRNTSDVTFETTSEPLIGLIDSSGSLIQSTSLLYTVRYTVIPFAGDTTLKDPYFSIDLNKRTASEKLPSKSISMLLKNALNGIKYVLVVTCENTSTPHILPAVSVELRIENCPRGSFPPPGLLGCDHCPLGGICDGTEVIITRNGFWKSPNATITYYSCPVGCKQGNQCLQGRTGVACASCDYGWTYNGNSCSECFPLVPLIVCLLIFLIVMCFLFVVWILFLALPLTSGRAFSKRINPLHGILFSSMFYLQTDGMIGELLLPTEWLKTLLLWQYRLTTGDLISVTFTSCLLRRMQDIGRERYTALCYYMAMPLTAFVFTVIVSVVMSHRRKTHSVTSMTLVARKATADAKGISDHRFLPLQPVSLKKLLCIGWCAIWCVLLHPLTNAAFNLIVCSSVVIADYPVHVEKAYLAVDSSLPCDSPYKNLAVFNLVIYIGIGVPVTAVIVWRYLQNGGLFLASFLTGSFKSRYWYWWIVLMGRRLVVSIIIKFSASSLAERPLIAINITSFLLLFATVVLQPWDSNALNRHETSLLTLSIASNQLLLHLLDSPNNAPLEIFVGAVKIISLILILKVIVMAIGKHFPGFLKLVTSNRNANMRAKPTKVPQNGMNGEEFGIIEDRDDDDDDRVSL